jgi:hypothetical protein
VRHGLRARRRWAWHALLAGHATWFLLDTGLSLAVGAVSNVVMINLLAGLGFLGLLVWARPAAWTAAEPCIPSAAFGHTQRPLAKRHLMGARPPRSVSPCTAALPIGSAAELGGRARRGASMRGRAGA